ncbi:MAG: hypothetical protein AB1486_05460 [Planctomycetota bacterium]
MRVLAWAILVVCASSHPALAQDAVVFDPAKHLEGFTEAQFSDYSDLYQFAPFEELEGRRMGTQELSEIQARWRVEQQRVLEKIQELRDDPLAAAAHERQKRFRFHRYFSRARLTEDLSHTGIAFYVQVPQNAPAGYVTDILGTYGSCVEEFVADLFAAIDATLGLERTEDPPVQAMVVLASYGEYADYYRVGAPAGPDTYGANYDPPLGLVVAYEDPLRRVTPTRKKTAARYAMTHAVLDSLLRSDAVNMPHFWLREGLARYYGMWDEQVGEEIRPFGTNSDDLREFATVLKEAASREAYFFPIKDLLLIGSQSEAAGRARQRAPEYAGKTESFGHRASEFFQIEACLFTCFLFNAEDSAYRTAVVQTLGDLWGVKRDPELKRVAELDPGKLQRGFVGFLDREVRKRCPALAFAESTRTALLPDPRNESGEVTSGGAAEEAFDPAAIEAGDIGEDVAIGKALQAARGGFFQEALKTIDDCLGTHGAKKDSLLTRERARLQLLAAARHSIVDQLIAIGKAIRLEHKGQTYSGTLQAATDTELSLSTKRDGVITLPLAALNPENLLWCVRNRKLEVAEPWLDAYLEFVAGDESWHRLARGGGIEAERLKQDAPELERCLRAAAVRETLSVLASTPIPEDVAEAQSLVATIEGLFAGNAGDPRLKDNEAALRQFAALGYAKLFDRETLREALTFNAKLEDLPDGRLRWTYSFDEASQLDGFVAADYLARDRRDYPELTLFKDKPQFEIAEKSLAISGALCRRLDLVVQAPLEISFDIVYSAKGYEDAERFPVGAFLLGFCHDGYGSHIYCAGVGSLTTIHKKSALREYTRGLEKYIGDTAYHVEVVHDGKEVRTIVDGEPCNKLPCGPLQSGDIFLWIQYDATVLLDNLTITGSPAPSYVQRCCNKWVEARVAALGAR